MIEWTFAAAAAVGLVFSRANEWASATINHWPHGMYSPYFGPANTHCKMVIIIFGKTCT